jgi:hypothetical protein
VNDRILAFGHNVPGVIMLTFNIIYMCFSVKQMSGEDIRRARNLRYQTKQTQKTESKPRMTINPPHHKFLRDYDSNQVQEIWEDFIEHDITGADPYYATSDSEYKDRVGSANKLIGKAKRLRKERSERGDFVYTINHDAFREAPLSEQRKLDSLLRFECRMSMINHHVCTRCNECSLGLNVDRKSVCLRCRTKTSKNDYTKDNGMLPLWVDEDGVDRMDVPDALACLTIAEKLLIQRISPLVPIVHVKNGTLGIKGHVCSFMQDITEVASTLPKLPKDVTAIKMIRTYMGSDGLPSTTSYIVNRQRVMNALRWLVKYHRDYKQAFDHGELAIDESNLDWIPTDAHEAELSSVANLSRTFETAFEVDGPMDHGVSRSQCIDPLSNNNDEEECSGFTCREKTSLVNDVQDALLNSLKEAAGPNTSISSLDWPQTSAEPISEYSNEMIFANAFPWLYPGGRADFRDPERKNDIDVSNWAQHLLRQSDGRFAKDKLWGFFVFNYCQRYRNNSSGGFFVNSHINNPPKSLQELQEQLAAGDSSFINKLVWYSKKVRGSDSYWRQMKAELYTWIAHHIEAGNGPPNIFMTLSCAEYFWPDMIRLLEERTWIAEGKKLLGGKRVFGDGRIIDFTENRADRNKAVNDHALTVQHFFIKRTEDFLNTVGKNLFGIEHYWGRMEFAKGRGQIHLHLLGILNKDATRDVQAELNNGNGSSNDHANAISSWAEKTFGMTASIPTKGHDDQ